MGDFNINLLNYDSHTPTFDFMNTFLSNNFLPCITHPTRISNNSATIIDNIFTNLTNSRITSGNILTSISDHFPQFLIFENANISYKTQELVKRDYSAFNETSFLNDFTMLDLSYLNTANDINHTYNRVLEDITSLIEKHVPIIKCTNKESRLKAKPWINHRITKMMKFRDRLLKKMKKNRNETNERFYKKFRNRVVNELKKSKKEYFQNYFAKNVKNMKKIWTGINSIISRKGYTHSSIDIISDAAGISVTDPAKMSNMFNEYFVNVPDSINKTIPRTPNLDFLATLLKTLCFFLQLHI